MAPAAADTTDPPGIVVEDGMTQPVFSFEDAIEQRVYVETPLDTDHDGNLDRVAIDLSRPQETETSGLKVPVVFLQTPYLKDLWFDVPYPSVLVDELPQNSLFDAFATMSSGDETTRHPRPDLAGSLDNYYVPRGYAVVIGQSIGTADPDGCPTSGDMAETLGTKAVIDWLNGRAKGSTKPATLSQPTGRPARSA